MKTAKHSIRAREIADCGNFVSCWFASVREMRPAFRADASFLDRSR